MDTYWAKIPIIRAAMMANPEAEWIWWMDADAVFTDMEFKIPLERYKDHNLVAEGWPNMVYDDKDNRSWTGLNTVLDQELSVVDGLDVYMGQNGPKVALLREMGADFEINVQGQATDRRHR